MGYPIIEGTQSVPIHQCVQVFFFMSLYIAQQALLVGAFLCIARIGCHPIFPNSLYLIENAIYET